MHYIKNYIDKKEQKRRDLEYLHSVGRLDKESFCAELDEIPREIRSLKKIGIISIKGEGEVVPKELYNLPKLKYLTLKCKIKEISSDIKNLKKIKHLDLSENSIDKLPDEIGECKKLVYLNVNDNNLTELPDTLEKLEIFTLSAARNKLTKFPRIGKDVLSMVYLQNNMIREIPLNTTKYLHKLVISNNKLTHLPENFGEMDMLEDLNLSHNEITYLPDSFGGLGWLKRFTMTNNPLYELPDSFGELKMLEYLDLDDCQIVRLPDTFGKLARLREFYICNNRLQELPISFAKLKLYKFEMKNNCVSWLPAEFGADNALKQLRMWGLRDNPLPFSTHFHCREWLDKMYRLQKILGKISPRPRINIYQPIAELI